MNCCANFVALYWKSIIAVLVPLILLPVFLLNDTSATKCLYVVLIVIIFWVTEALPLAVTSLIPIALFPLLGITTTSNVCKMYAHEIVIMLLGSLIIAISIEQCNLHKRIALKVLCFVAYSHRRLHFGLMIVSMFMSMWMQNIIVVAMMSPVCLAILEQFEAQGITTVFKPRTDKEILENPDKHPQPTRITICYLLGIAYAGSLGGCGTLYGTATNVTFKGIFEHYFPDAPEIEVLKFIEYGAPIMLVNTLLTWLWMQIIYMGMFRPKCKDAVAIIVSDEGAEVARESIRVDYADMGRLTAGEVQVGILLVFLVFVWVFRAPDFATGWVEYFPSKENEEPSKAIRDATPTILIIIFLFMLPSKWSCFNFCRRNKDIPQTNSESLLTWTYVRHKMPWGLVFLVGAGLAIADSGNRTEMSAMIGQFLSPIEKLGRLEMLFTVCLMCQILTEFSSNVAMANLILPVLADLCKVIKINPIYLMLPATFSTSMAFHLPTGTPANAFVAGLVNIPKKHMILCGFGPSIITLLTYWGSFYTYGAIIYTDLDKFSTWANVPENNGTETTNNSTKLNAILDKNILDIF